MALLDNETLWDLIKAPLLNLSDIDVATRALYTTPEKIIIGIAMPIVFGVGVLANLAFLYVIYRVSYMRCDTNHYLGHLAISDICFLLVTILEKMLAFVDSPISGDSAFDSSLGCVLYTMTVYLTYFASMGLITLVSLERFFALCVPIKHRRFKGRKHRIRLIALNWLLSVVLAGVVTLGYAKLETTCILWPNDTDFHTLPATYEYCGPLDERFEHTSTIQVIAFPLVLTGNTIMYWRIIRSLSNRLSSNHSGGTSDQNRQARNQVAWMLVINGLVFFICHLPFNLQNAIGLASVITGETYIGENAGRVFVWVGRLATYMNSAANPFIFTTMSRRYRQAYKEAFGFICCRKVYRMEVFSTMSNLNGKIVANQEQSHL